MGKVRLSVATSDMCTFESYSSATLSYRCADASTDMTFVDRSLFLLLSALVLACHQPAKVYPEIADATDLHTYARPAEARVHDLTLQLEVDFDTRMLSGYAEWHFSRDSIAQEIIFDTYHLHIDSIICVLEGSQHTLPFDLSGHDAILGSALTLTLPDSGHTLRIYYRTAPDAPALQWLGAHQTQSKRHPLLYSQGQPVLTRSWIPCQDSPGIRFTYNARVKAPRGLLVLMSATNPVEVSEDGWYTFSMDQPIPAYLMALAVGNLAFDTISARCGIYAEPEMLPAAIADLEDLEKMMRAAEYLFGSYDWQRYDVLFLPPAFPFGGMENPRLTFATPTILTGDKSLTSLIAHELAHSWSGNLVTNATWEDFWINEGHTVYLELRIMEALYGREYAQMLARLGYNELQQTLNDMGPNDPDSRLKLELKGRDPDDGMTAIAYEKGCLLLQNLEERVGREHFDAFLRQYFEAYRYRSISTEQWEVYVQQHLLDPLKIDFDLAAWLYRSGLPEDHWAPESRRMQIVEHRRREFVRIGRLDRSTTRSWSSHEWVTFLQGLPTDLHESFLDKLDAVFALSASTNAEILSSWLRFCILSGYTPPVVLTGVEDFLTTVGRRKFVLPMYQALMANDHGDLAGRILQKARGGYHTLTLRSIESLFQPTEPPL